MQITPSSLQEADSGSKPAHSDASFSTTMLALPSQHHLSLPASPQLCQGLSGSDKRSGPCHAGMLMSGTLFQHSPRDERASNVIACGYLRIGMI